MPGPFIDLLGTWHRRCGSYRRSRESTVRFRAPHSPDGGVVADYEGDVSPAPPEFAMHLGDRGTKRARKRGVAGHRRGEAHHSEHRNGEEVELLGPADLGVRSPRVAATIAAPPLRSRAQRAAPRSALPGHPGAPPTCICRFISVGRSAIVFPLSDDEP
jgi:hypothetical protein